MPKHLKEVLNSKVSGGDFDSMIEFLRDSINTRMPTQESLDVKDVDQTWLGVRQQVELPLTHKAVTKNLVPEILDQNFMQIDDYFHYEDWE